MPLPPTPPRLRACLALALVLLAVPASAADRTVKQEITLPAGPLPFTAAVETIRLTDPAGATQAEIVTTAFLGEGANRPVTFVLNGGPGSASAWLDVGAVGPWRVPLGSPSADPTPQDNAETWLPFTDLVFIDPPGTGYSRALGDEAAQRRFRSVDGDIAALASVIRRWLQAHDRLAAPKFILGESYGGFRAPRLARALLDDQGIGVRGLVLLSPVLDFNGRDAAYDPMRWVARLPSLAAAAKAARARSDLVDAEAYARGEYLADLVRGPNDAAAQDRIAARLAALTGLDEATIRRREGRIDFETALRTRNPGRVASPYDATIQAADPFPAAVHDNSPDPVLDGLRAPVTQAMLMIYRRLGWEPEGAPNRQYQLLDGHIASAWDYGRGNHRPESMTALRQFVSLDPAARVLVAHGLTDLVTPYFASVLLLDQVPETEPAGRVVLRAYPGGHMMYTDALSRAALTADAAQLIRSALAPTAPTPAAPLTPPAPGAPTAAGGTPPPPPPPAPAPGTPSPPATPR